MGRLALPGGMPRLAAALVAVVATTGAGLALPASAHADRAWVTSPTQADRRLQNVSPGAGRAAPAEIVVDVDDVRQTWWGTGAALTDASVTLLKRRPAAVRMLVGAGPGSAHLDAIRLPLSSTDLSAKPWSWRWSAGRSTPPGPAERATRFLRDGLLARNPDLRVVASPWSAPPGMKTSRSLHGGRLRADATAAYADLLADQAAWAAAQGTPYDALTIANEPGHTSDYPTMAVPARQQAAVGRLLAARLAGTGTGLWALDHNWAERRTLDRVLARAGGAYDAAAFHCYRGSPRRMADLPLPRLVTECTGTTDTWRSTFAWDARQLVARPVAAGSSGLLMWSLALDPRHGPRDRASYGGCAHCRGLLTIGPHRIRRGPEFFTLAHLTRAAAPGSRVLGARAPRGIRVAAFRRPDGSIGVFGHNDSGARRRVSVRVGATSTGTYVVRPGELFTITR